MEYWNDGLSLVNSMHQRISVASVQSYRRWVGFSFFQYSTTPTLHKYVEQRRVMESHLPGQKSTRFFPANQHGIYDGSGLFTPGLKSQFTIGIFGNSIPIECQAQTRIIGDRQHTFLIKSPDAGSNFINIRRAGDVFY